VRGGDAHPVAGKLRTEIPGPIGRTYPVSAVGRAVADGIERRRRSIVVPGWLRGLLVARAAIAPLVERASFDRAAEADRLFSEDIEARGAETASAPVGAGGAAARERQPARRGKPGRQREPRPAGSIR
jgi:hypothetical protein